MELNRPRSPWPTGILEGEEKARVAHKIQLPRNGECESGRMIQRETAKLKFVCQWVNREAKGGREVIPDRRERIWKLKVDGSEREGWLGESNKKTGVTE